MTNNSNKLVALNEVFGAYATHQLSNEGVNLLKADANNFIKSNFDIDIDGDISIIENSENEINLALPFYSGVEDIKAMALKDKNLDNISGGEILITVFAAIGVAAGVASGVAIAGAASGLGIGLGIAGGIAGGVVGAAVVGVGINAAVQHSNGNNFDGSKKVAVGAAQAPISKHLNGGGK